MIGLPGAGKTTGILQYLHRSINKNIAHLDIRNFSGPHREHKIYKAVTASNKPTIVESACGISYIKSKIIRLQTNITIIESRLKERDGLCDLDYLSLLSSAMLYPDYTINTTQELSELLNCIFD